MNSKSISLLRAISWLGLIWLVSSLPSSDVPSVKIWSFDKFAHFTIYLILGLLFNQYISAGKLGKKPTIFLYLALIVTAGLDEWHQTFIPGRSVSCYDFFANLSGLVTAFILQLNRKPKK